MASLITAQQALFRLMEGNRKFRSQHYDVHPTAAKIQELVSGQHPYAAIVSCADSRVPPNEIFDCDLGEIFVVRNAGNVIGTYDLGSIEYAVEHLHTPLVMVLGHRNCGAVASAYGWTGGEGALAQIMNEVTPSVALARRKASDQPGIINLAEQYNVENSLRRLRESPILAALPAEALVGAMYDISTGEVTLL